MPHLTPTEYLMEMCPVSQNILHILHVLFIKALYLKYGILAEFRLRALLTDYSVFTVPQGFLIKCVTRGRPQRKKSNYPDFMSIQIYYQHPTSQLASQSIDRCSIWKFHGNFTGKLLKQHKGLFGIHITQAVQIITQQQKLLEVQCVKFVLQITFY